MVAIRNKIFSTCYYLSHDQHEIYDPCYSVTPECRLDDLLVSCSVVSVEHGHVMVVTDIELCVIEPQITTD